MREEIISSIQNLVNYLKNKDYWNDINSFCLYTDEYLMSLSLLFNTNSYYTHTLDPEYPLTFKFMPSEWYSETIKLEEDEILYNNTFFKEIEEELRKIQFGERSKIPNLYKQLIEAMKYCISTGVFPKKESNIYLVMKSDNYNGKDILKDNRELNSDKINSELKDFVKNEL